MTPARWRQISRLYAEASGRDATARARFLDEACAGDALLREEVASLLAEDGADSLPVRAIGQYELGSLIGTGGMGQVFRARDSKLERDVAVKVIPRLLALDDQRRARVRREAQLLASLNHPNIAQIYGIEEVEGVYALILELVEGETLAGRIARGPLPMPEAIAIARQIAQALGAAHEQNVVHRDLKPENIKVRRDGTVKILDFGLAKALAPEDRGSDVLLTASGAVLGTITYMAPEQARGEETDRRVDVWAFGVVLYEMLSGRSPFAGGSMAETVGAVLHTEPDWKPIPRDLQPLLRHCLEKNPAHRLPDIAAAMRGLDARPPQSRRTAATPWISAAASILIAGAMTLAFVLSGREPSSTQPLVPQASGIRDLGTRYQISAPPPYTIGSYFVLSPDGRHLAYWAADGGGRRGLWVHSFDRGRSEPLPGAGAVSSSSMVWAPDNRRVAFVDNAGVLRQIDIVTGEARTICPLRAGWGGGAWNADDEIIFGQQSGGLMRVSAGGGVPAPVTLLDDEQGEIGHGAPRFLPDGRHFVYARATTSGRADGLYTGALDTAPGLQSRTPLLRTRSRAIYAPSPDPGSGHLLLVSGRALLAYPFDAGRLRLSGVPVRIADDVATVASGGALISAVSASATGLLAYRSRDARTVEVVRNWMKLLEGTEG